MITIDRLSLPTSYVPKVGDLLQITEITGGNGKWCFKVSQAGKAEKLPKDVLAWLVRHLAGRDAAEFMLWYTIDKPLPGEAKA